MRTLWGLALFSFMYPLAGVLWVIVFMGTIHEILVRFTKWHARVEPFLSLGLGLTIYFCLFKLLHPYWK